AASEELAQEISKMLTPHLNCLPSVTSGAPPTRPIFEIMVGKTAEIMQRAWVGIVASGSATLEAAYFRMPFALVYKVAWPTYLANAFEQICRMAWRRAVSLSTDRRDCQWRQRESRRDHHERAQRHPRRCAIPF